MTSSTYLILIVAALVNACAYTTASLASIAAHKYSGSNFLNASVLETIRDTICMIETKKIHIFFVEKRTSTLTNNLLGQLNRCHSAPILVHSIDKNLINRGLVRNYYTSIQIFIIAEPVDYQINYGLSLLNKKLKRKDVIKFIVIFEKVNEKQRLDIETWLTATFRNLFKRNALNVVIMFAIDNRLQVFTYNPYDGESATGIRVIPVTSWQPNDYFYEKVHDLHGSSLKVAMHIDNVRVIGNNATSSFVGVDGFLAETFAMKLNSKIEYLLTDSSRTYENGCITGGLELVSSGRADLSFNARIMFPEQQDNYVDLSNSYERENLCVIVPKAGERPRFYSIFGTFRKWLWASILLAIIISILGYSGLQKWQNHIKKKKFTDFTTLEITELMLQSLLRNSMSHICRSQPIRIFLGSWLIYSLLVRSAFTGKLISHLVVPTYEPDINSIEELLESDLNIHFNDDLEYFIRETLDEGLWERLEQKIVGKNVTSSTGSSFVMARAMKEHEADYVTSQYFDWNTGRPLYHKMRECLAYFPMTYFFNRGSPLLGRFNELHSRFFETGIIRHFADIMDYENLLKRQYDEMIPEHSRIRSTKIVLNMEHLQGVFYLWGIGLTLATVVFVIECLVKFRKE